MTDRAGQQLGNYRLVRRLGEGGFAEVYLAEQVYLQSQAAIKVLHTRLGKDDLEGFLSEARTIVRLKHPNIVRLLEFGVEENTPYLVMDYAPHGTLRDRHPRGTPLPLATTLPYVKQVAEALQYAHEQKLIHRDVKPENMLLGERGELLLSDFGIATVAQSSRYQQTEGVVGTAAYMAPEQLQGKPRPASDQYALGVVIYEWLTGTRPFNGSFTEIASQHVLTPPPPLREKVPAISPAIEQVVLTALAKDPHERFASMQAFATALEQASLLNQPTVGVKPAAALPPTIRASAPPVTSPPPTLPQTRSSEQWLKDGNTLIQSKQYEQALTAYEQVLHLDPRYAPAYIGKGQALFWLKRYYEALAAYEEAMHLDPASAQPYLGKARALIELKSYQEALSALEQALQRDPASGIVYSDMGLVLWRLGRMNEAMHALERATELAPGHAQTYYHQGLILSDLKRYPEALAAFERAILLDPKDVLAYIKKGRAQLALKRYEEALATYDLAARLDPDNHIIHSNRGYALLNLQRPAQALQAFEQAIKRDPNFGRAWRNKGVALHMLGMETEANRALQKASELGEW